MGNKKIASTGSLMLVLFLGVLMGAMDIAIIGPALPSMKGDFGVTERDLALLFSVYILFNLVGTPLMAKLSDLFGRRLVYIVDVVLFALGSMGVALAPSFAAIVAARALQGFGAGGIFPVASAVIGDVFPQEKRGGALGIIGMVFGLAFIIGPILGGILLPFGWRWLFWINVPLALLVIVLGLGRLPHARHPAPGRFDSAGALVLSLLLGAFAFGLSRMDSQAFLSSLMAPGAGGLVLFAIVLVPLFIAIERKAESPIIDLGLFANGQIAVTGVLNVLAGMVESGLVFLPLYAVSAFGASKASASYLLLPLVLAMSIGAPLVGRALDRLGPRPVVLFGSATLSLGLLGLGFAAPFGLAGFIVTSALVGLGLSALLGAPIRYILLHEAPPAQRSVAQGLVNIQGGAGQLVAAAAIGGVTASIADKALAFGIAFRMLAIVSIVAFAFSFAIKGKSAAMPAAQTAVTGGELP
ncbi:MAG TPA: MFS transporter [Rectinemataceae bacterium]|nr:MFS transporter [Rectinemataceae bacterium]